MSKKGLVSVNSEDSQRCSRHQNYSSVGKHNKYVSKMCLIVLGTNNPQVSTRSNDNFSGISEEVYPQVNVHGTSGLILMGTTLFLLFVGGGTWAALAFLRPDIIESISWWCGTSRRALVCINRM